MKIKYNENMSSLEANYEVVSLDSSYQLDVIENRDFFLRRLSVRIRL